MRKFHRHRINRYILNAIDGEGYGVTFKKTETEAKLRFLYQTFRDEYGHNLGRMTEKDAFLSWCQGLPSCFAIEFMNHEIGKLGLRLGVCTEATEMRFVDRYWTWLTEQCFRLFRQHHIIERA